MSQELDQLRHSAAHLLAAAVLDLFPNTKPTIGPSIENGFYYDFDFESPISEADLPKIEKRMQQLVKTWTKFEKIDVDKHEALNEFSHNQYKTELIEEFGSKDQNLTIYQSGKFRDLCRGGHIENPKEELKHFKLLSIAGAYWRGNEKNKMLTRIYGTAFATKEELDLHLHNLEEAKRRDHRRLGKELDLFHFQPEAPGMPFWHPKGMIIRNELIKFSREIQNKYGYKEVLTPILMRQEVYQQSGHWDHYQNDMFFSEYETKNDILALKPMNCPGMIQIYKERPRSYRDLPLKMSEYGIITRKEQSGELNGLFRVMQAWQDDAHLFVTQNDIPKVVEETISLVNEIYDFFGIKYQAFLSTRPDKYMGSREVWDQAETALKESMTNAGLELNLKEKDGAFYGPKIDYQLVDALGRDWQCGTIQLDFQMPQAFDLEFMDNDGQQKRPVIIHRTIVGSLERFIGILVEHFGGSFPAWLSPVQVAILPINDKVNEYCQDIANKLKQAGIRVEVSQDDSLGKRIRQSELQKTPYMLIIGEKEAAGGSVSVRIRGEKDEGSVPFEQFLDRITKNIEERSLIC